MENSENSFSFPSIHNFPPFYTLQPTQTTWQNQAALWSEIILSYYRHHKLYRLNLSESLNSDLFNLNSQGIRRKLKLDTLQAIIDTMVYRGTAEWDPPSKKDSAIIYWRKPEDWANLINNWVLETGMSNSIVTVYEIAHGDSAEGFEFHGLDQTILMKALDILVKKGVAQIFQGTSTDDMGVKFFGVNG
ncbi:ESCRT-II complex, vps25 subunit [Rhizophagus irregularis]|uniref:Vacuolar protein-sorting-associated protein 25 n=2 Tax=Rhizophagus irregularis TaxID=588596 RepID=U9TQ77_RHIID|nr:vacuolar protein sorting 25 [Rhizophagus irregularis DAOM 181602=DAOM 197198]PKC13438.1 ESCRT-II complex, vps25 subunit [Rhizophagus irregularis]PKC64205.1 ESCRT-II complex, vps25 subunit [Rhizophagus irregularis]PKK75375.1 ESCRT-II complex, vps25 subunit [Rhizophagus irregularis]PKY26766.1 ESCRT-II complex, vps25 subunit [Rhizophagus irregularis]POG57712.1 vacuolar protein sorting 25 [Rhizophagus irregularis DAOM 181602=DAOM 197198]|eukprot:XP_025164578.1 vacuolar protein sorting 25 [Rhizophagus irregularis DAOM 181602=DAOM 197198]